MPGDVLKKIRWLGHDSFRLDAGKVVYVDPFKLSAGAPKADLILITHEHHDHFSPEDVEPLRKAGTSIVTIAAVAQKLRGDVHIVRPGDKLTVQGIEIEAVPAYNVDKKFHPQAAGHVGFIVTMDGQRVYHAGDADVIPEMTSLHVDVALLPVSGTYCMTAEQAIEATKKIRPKLAIPMHYGTIVGEKADAERFAAGAPAGVEVVILAKES